MNETTGNPSSVFGPSLSRAALTRSSSSRLNAILAAFCSLSVCAWLILPNAPWTSSIAATLAGLPWNSNRVRCAHEWDRELVYDVVIFIVKPPPVEVGQEVDSPLVSLKTVIASLQLHFPRALVRSYMALIYAKIGRYDCRYGRNYSRKDCLVVLRTPPSRDRPHNPRTKRNWSTPL